MIAARLRDLEACPEAIEWVGERRSARRAWEECPRGDWLIWVASASCGRRRGGVRPLLRDIPSVLGPPRLRPTGNLGRGPGP